MSFLQNKLRATKLLVKLPSQGNHQPIGNISLSELGYIEVMPMNARNEIDLSNPDLLVSGAAITKLMESCLPSVKDPRKLPYPDVQIALLAIKRASHGKVLQTDVQCPKCEKISEISYQIDSLIAEYNVNLLPKDNISVELEDGFFADIYPYTWEQFNEMNFELFSIIQQDKAIDEAIKQSTIDQAKANEIKSNLRNNITNSALARVAGTVQRMHDADNEVTDKEEIAEYFKNCDSDYIKKINVALDSLMKGGIREVKHTCQYCEHEWESTPSFNPTLFFAPRSPA